MSKFPLQTLQRNWLWLFVNGAGVALSVRTGWLLFQAPPQPEWSLVIETPALRTIVLFTGKSALIFLVLSLACTPLARLLGWKATLQVRKALGLWGFAFACFHSIFFLEGTHLFNGWNPGPELWQALQSMIGIVRYGSKIPYAEAGVYALSLLFLLAITSNRLAMQRLGKNWKRLHRLVYLAVPVAIYHYWWRTVAPYPVPPPPDSWQVFLFALIVGLLLAVRVPPVRRWVTKTLARLKRQPLRTPGQPLSEQRVLPTGRQALSPLPKRMSIGRPPAGMAANGVAHEEVQGEAPIAEKV